MKHSKRFLEIVKAVKARVKETNVQTIRARQKKGDTFYLVDVREDNEWDKGHLPGAIHLGKGVIERDVEGVIPDVDAEIVLYCGGGYRSALAAENLARMGYTNVVSMDGGFRGWTEAGFPIEHDD
ncbi:MAG TPA: rhodanese-like domain-containing protein [Candidatus Krumholzibacteria bacterium]|nr:rhodanese-like domain-containing protein [Candidatus Krumholzibacteria bacterium]